MSSVYVPTPAQLTTITIPSDGDPETAASVNSAFQDLANGVAYNNRPANTAAVAYPLATQSITRIQRGLPGFAAGEWAQTSSLPFCRVVGAGQVYLFQQLEIPLSVFLNDVTLYVHPAGAHVGVPALPPKVKIYEIDITTNPETYTAITTDVIDPTSGVLGSYESNHGIPVSLGAGVAGYLVINSAKKYMATLLSEGGANALANFQYTGCKVGWTTTGMDLGAS